MNFLNPAILFGLIAAALPLVLHLLNLRKLQQIEFSTLHFLKEMQKNKIRRVKLKQIILLILRTLLIICVVLAFARPTVERNVAGMGSFARSSNVIILDNSFSLNVSDENGNRFTQAKRAVNNILNAMNEGDEVCIIEMANMLNTKMYSFSRNIDYLRDEVGKTKIAYCPANFDAALSQSAKILEGANNFTKNIFIVTDAQPNIFENKFDKIEARNTSVYFIPIGDKSKIKNISLDSIDIISKIFQLNKSIEIDAYVNNYSETSSQSTLLSLSFNKQNVAQRSFNIESQSKKTISIGAIPQQAGVINAAVELESDAFMEDNKRFFGFIIPDNPKVALISDNNISTDFTYTALNETREDGFADVTFVSGGQFGSLAISQFALLIIENAALTANNYNLLKQYIYNGGSALIFAQQSDAFNTLMNELGFGELKLKEYSPDHPNTFSTTEKTHPLFEGVFKFDNNARSVVESPKIFKALPANAAQNIIEMGNNNGFLVENNYGEGRILYCAVNPSLEWSTLPITGIFPAIVVRSLAYLSATQNDVNEFELGTPVQITIPKKLATSDNFKIVDPNGNEFLRQAAILPSNAILQLSDMNMPGVYAIYNGNEQIVMLVSLNLNKTESNFTQIPQDSLKSTVSKRFSEIGELEFITDTDDIASAISHATTGTELWRLFVLIALLCAITEMLVQKNFKNENIN